MNPSDKPRALPRDILGRAIHGVFGHEAEKVFGSVPRLWTQRQAFSNPSGENEGKKFIGEQPFVSTDSSGNATFPFSPATAVAVGQTITATAKNGASDTSEFSVPRKVASS
jgi:hypothetical protein